MQSKPFTMHTLCKCLIPQTNFCCLAVKKTSYWNCGSCESQHE
uniref:Uncharacterized protein n=1 Tax=Anguilla anguilla TaxID=7936 RepID=A0A0E9PBW8_ANGAN